MKSTVSFFRRSFAAGCLTVALILSGCASGGKSPASTEPVTPIESPSQLTEDAQPAVYEHVMGSITLNDHPKRIVAPYLEDALLTLGVEPAAKWAYGDLVQQYLEPYMPDVPRLDFAGGLNKEALMTFDPELVVLYTSRLADEDSYKQFSQIAPTYVFEDGTLDWKMTLRLFGDMLGRQDQAESAIAQYEAKAAEAREKLMPYTEGKTFAVVRAKPKEIQLMDGIYYSGPIMYEDLGLTPHSMVKELSWEHAVSLSLEVLPDLDTDYLFVLVQDDASRVLLDEFTDSILWKNLPAVKNGHVFEMPANYWMATGAIANNLKIDDVVHALTE